MKGEIGIKIKNIKVSGYNHNKGTFDISLYEQDGGFLHICGDNNWNKLLKDAFDEIHKDVSTTSSTLFYNSGNISDRDLREFIRMAEGELNRRQEEPKTLPF